MKKVILVIILCVLFGTERDARAATRFPYSGKWIGDTLGHAYMIQFTSAGRCNIVFADYGQSTARRYMQLPYRMRQHSAIIEFRGAAALEFLDSYFKNDVASASFRLTVSPWTPKEVWGVQEPGDTLTMAITGLIRKDNRGRDVKDGRERGAGNLQMLKYYAISRNGLAVVGGNEIDWDEAALVFTKIAADKKAKYIHDSRGLRLK